MAMEGVDSLLVVVADGLTVEGADTAVADNFTMEWANSLEGTVLWSWTSKLLMVLSWKWLMICMWNCVQLLYHVLYYFLCGLH